MGEELPPDFTHTDEVSLLRPALFELAIAARRIDDQWGRSDPVTQGVLWKEMREKYKEALRVYNAIEDPHPELCGRRWYDALDHAWTRCGLEPRHNGVCLAPWMINQKKQKSPEG